MASIYQNVEHRGEIAYVTIVLSNWESIRLFMLSYSFNLSIWTVSWCLISTLSLSIWGGILLVQIIKWIYFNICLRFETSGHRSLLIIILSLIDSPKICPFREHILVARFSRKFEHTSDARFDRRASRCVLYSLNTYKFIFCYLILKLKSNILLENSYYDRNIYVT